MYERDGSASYTQENAMPKPLQIESLDAIDHSKFVVHFSDETSVAVTAQQLANCFPQRTQIPEQNEEED